jgi:hypothetical protein
MWLLKRHPMAKLLTLFKRDETDAPFAPVVEEEIVSAESDLAKLEAGRGAAALSAMTEGGDVNAIAKLDAEAASIRARIFNLRAAYRAANERDARQAAEAWYQRQLSDLGAFAAALAERDAAVIKFCESMKIAAESYREIFELSDAVAVLLPEGTQLPSGFSAHHGEVRVDGLPQAAPLDHLASHEMFRHSGVTRPGQSGALPGSKPFSLSTLFRADAIEPWDESSKRLSDYFVEAVKNQIEIGHRAEVDAIDGAMEADVA